MKQSGYGCTAGLLRLGDKAGISLKYFSKINVRRDVA
jgi:hypothetical protein